MPRMPNLTSLFLDGNEIESIGAIKGMRKLKILNLSGNFINNL